MSLIDKKERIFDIVLTDRGKNLLSQNLLEFEYYAFGDNEVSYSGSIDVVLKTTGTLDDNMIKNLSFEADQKHNSLKDQTLNSWLFTMPSNDPVLPQFKLSNTGSITLNRKYKIQKIDEPILKRVDVLSTITIEEATADRHISHIYSQLIEKQLAKEAPPPAPANSFLTDEIRNLVANIKKVASFGSIGQIFGGTSLIVLKNKYKDLTGGRDYNSDLAAGLI